MQNLRDSQSARDAKWAEMTETYHQKVDVLQVESDKIQQGHDDLKRQQDEMNTNHGGANVNSSDVLDISAGGKIITVTRGTLTQLEGTPLAALFSGRWENQFQRDTNGRIFLDVNPSCFQSIVDYLNELKISPPDAPLDPPVVEKDDEVFLDRLLTMFGMEEMCSPPLDTVILMDRCQVEALYGFLSDDIVDRELELLYRGSRDGFGTSDFHTKCDNEGATVTVIKDSDGYLFGGFTDMPWMSAGGWCSTSKSFLFSLHCHSGLGPAKLKQRAGMANHAMYNDASHGPLFGAGNDISVQDKSNVNMNSNSNIGNTYECPPGQDGKTFLTGNRNFKVAEIEVFSVSQSSTKSTASNRKRKASDGQLQHVTEHWENITFDDVSSYEMRAVLRTEQQMLIEANEELRKLKHAFEQEKGFITFFVLGETKDIINFNVSGELMSINKATLNLFKESVLAKQFNDPNWAKEESNSYTLDLVKKWSPNEVSKWISSIDGLSTDASKLLSKHSMNGMELLTLDYESLKIFGITRPPTLSLLMKEVRELQKEGNHGESFLIEQSAYCFGKILDHLRLHAMCHTLQDPAPLPPPDIREPYRNRFKRIVEFYFPGDSDAFE